MLKIVIRIIFMMLVYPAVAGLAVTYPNPTPGAQINYEEEVSHYSGDLLLAPVVSLEEPSQRAQKFNHISDHQMIPLLSVDDLERPPRASQTPSLS